MGLIPVGAIFKGFTFDGEDSKDYGVYISGEAVFNAPERAVDMVEIPGRSGAYALDLGRFENIEVRYPAGIAADNETDFASGISALRNFLASRRGYCRLEDEYNPDEYRLAVYKSGLEVTPAQLKAGEFEIVFDCMPQRFLKSGEVAQAVTSGDTVTNPTLFDSCPLLSVVGYGAISINGESLEVLNNPIGDVVLAPWSRYKRADTDGLTSSLSITTEPDYTPLVLGDSVRISNSDWNNRAVLFAVEFVQSGNVFADSITWTTNGGLNSDIVNGAWNHNIQIFPDTLTYTYGTPTTRATETVNVTVTKGASTSTFRIVVGWQVNSGDFDVVVDMTAERTSTTGTAFIMRNPQMAVGPIIGFSTYSANTDPVYVDLDIGEAYTYINGEIVSYNSKVNLPWDLPTIAPGSNSITYDNTITQFEITPRWWRV